jgi:FkbM family methyltransferase
MHTIFDEKHYLELIEARGALIRRIVPELKKVLGMTSALDAGCGSGFFAQLLSDCHLNVLGIDGRQVNVDEAGKRYKGISFQTRDIEDPSIRQLESFDLVVCFGLLYHLENPLKAIRNLRILTRKVLLLESMCLPSAQPLALLRHEFTASDQSLTDLAFYPSEGCIVKMLYRSGYPHVYRIVPAPDHEDFRDTPQHFRRRIALCAALEPVNLQGLISIAEPPEPPDPWRKETSRARRLLAGVRKFMSKSTAGKVDSVAFRLRYFLPQKTELTTLPFGSKWVSRDGALDRELKSGTFENHEMGFVSCFLREGMNVLDIGAHHGLYTLLASKLVGRSGKVFAFEPSPRERKRLKQHLKLNACANVKVEDFALGSVDGLADLFVVDGEEDYCNSLRPPAVRAKTRKVAVEISTLDGFLERERIGRVDFIKIDVEGAELEVLKGASKLLDSRERPVFLIEVYDTRTTPWGYRARDIVRFLDRHGYQLAAQQSGTWQQIEADRDVYDANLVAVPREITERVLSVLKECRA